MRSAKRREAAARRGPCSRISTTAPLRSAPASWSTPALGHARAMAGEDDRRVGDALGRLAADQDHVAAPATSTAAPRAVQRTWLAPGPRARPGGPAGTSCRPRPPARAPRARELLGDIGDGQPLALGAGRAALEFVAGEPLDMAHHLGRRDRRVGLGRERRRRRKRAGADAAPRSSGLNMALLKERRFGLASDSRLSAAPWRSGARAWLDVQRLDHPPFVALGAAGRRGDQPLAPPRAPPRSGRRGGWRSRSGSGWMTDLPSKP